VKSHLSLERLRASTALDTILLDEGEDAILAFDQVLGDGSGKTLERVACEMLARQLLQAASAVRVGDLFGTVARLRAPIEHPFVNAPVQFELAKTPSGFRLTIGISGRPRSTRVLAHVAAGAIHAAERFVREALSDPLRLELATFADRARIDAHYRRASVMPAAPDPVPASRRSSGATRLVPSLSDEVSRILDPSLTSAARSASEPPRRPSTETPAVDGRGPTSERPSARPPAAPRSPTPDRPSSRPPSNR
jgi:hypothetical protein